MQCFLCVCVFFYPRSTSQVKLCTGFHGHMVNGYHPGQCTSREPPGSPLKRVTGLKASQIPDTFASCGTPRPVAGSSGRKHSGDTVRELLPVAIKRAIDSSITQTRLTQPCALDKLFTPLSLGGAICKMGMITTLALQSTSPWAGHGSEPYLCVNSSLKSL